LQAASAQFRARKTKVLALAYQDVSRAQLMKDIVQADYPILADVDHAVADTYGVFNLLGDGVATPSVFVIDPAGRIAWSYVGKDANDRPSPADVLSHVP
jgi:peroxiredoxin